jgi:hypothetical protein
MVNNEVVRKIQLLLSYKNIKNTVICAHVTSQAIQGLKPPFDDLKIESTDEH